MKRGTIDELDGNPTTRLNSAFGVCCRSLEWWTKLQVGKEKRDEDPEAG